ncbi:biotin/lipoyl-binding protein [Niabella sp.]|uniref:HlyD family secretion protein n=1 Tax=Niabella sp. TaxID=1962976 RepID=UPI0026102DC4|nr:biotin/lipoyl-binding protein [Niabella sp.]
MKKIFINSSLLLSITAIISCGDVRQPQSSAVQGKVKIESIAIAPKIAGRIEKVFVREGQRVQKGDTLAVLSVPEIEARLEQANGAVEAAAGQLQLAHNGATADQLLQVSSQVDAAVAQLNFAEQSFKRMQHMYNDSLVPAQQYDDVKAKYQMARAQVSALKAKQKEIQSGTRPETIQSARGQVQRAEGAKKEVLQAARERVLLAPSEMTIESITLKEGELATPGYALFNGYETGGIYFRFTIGEKAVYDYQPGQPVTIQIPGGNRSVAATVVAVKQLPRYADNTSTAPNREVGEGFFEVKISPVTASDASGLYNNTTVLLAK